MKRTVGAVSALMLVGASLIGVASATQAASSWDNIGHIEMKPAEYCSVDYPDLCNPTLSLYTLVTKTDENNADVSLKMTDSSGKRIYPEYGYYVDNYYEYQWALPQSLKQGIYKVTTTATSSAHWSCSIYDPNGCSWLPAERQVLNFAITWNGRKVRAHHQVATSVTIDKFNAKKIKRGKAFTVRGDVNYGSPSGKIETLRSRVKLEIRQRNKKNWKQLKTVNTGGRFAVKFKLPKKRTRYVIRATAYPIPSYGIGSSKTRSMRIK